MRDNTIIVIGGPTAVGKTNLSIELAKKINGEIISADSMQIYRYMDIGSAKIKVEERQGITHHLIDVVNPDEPFSVADFKELGQDALNDIWSRGKTPIIAGGTGLYINALTCNMTFTEGEKDLKYRKELDALADKFGNDHIHEMLNEIDPISYKEIHSNNRKRVIRALEVFKLTGKPFSSYNIGNDMYNSPYNVKYYVLNMNREQLYERINKRVDMMMDEGLLDECIKLHGMGYTSSMQSMQGIGYKEILYYLDGAISLAKAVDMIKQGSRNYAKRQLTWFRKDPRVKFFDKDNLSENDILKKICDDIIFD